MRIQFLKHEVENFRLGCGVKFKNSYGSIKYKRHYSSVVVVKLSSINKNNIDLLLESILVVFLIQFDCLKITVEILFCLT